MCFRSHDIIVQDTHATFYFTRTVASGWSRRCTPDSLRRVSTPAPCPAIKKPRWTGKEIYDRHLACIDYLFVFCFTGCWYRCSKTEWQKSLFDRTTFRLLPRALLISCRNCGKSMDFFTSIQIMCSILCYKCTCFKCIIENYHEYFQKCRMLTKLSLRGCFPQSKWTFFYIDFNSVQVSNVSYW